MVCGQPSDRGRLKNRTEQDRTGRLGSVHLLPVTRPHARVAERVDERQALAHVVDAGARLGRDRVRRRAVGERLLHLEHGPVERAQLLSINQST